jgi:hypothetical protein
VLTDAPLPRAAVEGGGSGGGCGRDQGRGHGSGGGGGGAQARACHTLSLHSGCLALASHVGVQFS